MVEGRLADVKNHLEEVLKAEGAKRVSLQILADSNREREVRRKQIEQEIRVLRDKIVGVEKEKSSREKDFESKRLTINNEILAQTNQLDKVKKEAAELEFESAQVARETEQMKTLIRQNIEQTCQMLLALKREHRDKLESEAGRLETVKEGLFSYMRQRKK